MRVQQAVEEAADMPVLVRSSSEPGLLRRSLKLAEAEITVEEAATSAERSYTTAFWPEHGAVAAVAGGFVIQACPCSVVQEPVDPFGVLMVPLILVSITVMSAEHAGHKSRFGRRIMNS